MLDDFLAKLRTPEGPVGMGNRWVRAADSDGLVVIIARCDFQAGAQLDGCVLVTTGRSWDVRGDAPSDPDFGMLDVPTRPVGPVIPYLTDVIAHELAHTIKLGNLHDEYSGRVLATPVSQIAKDLIEVHANTQMLEEVGDSFSIDAGLLKWNWPRAQAAARVANCTADGALVVFELPVSHALRWTPAPAGRPVWLHKGELWVPDPMSGLPVQTNPLQLDLVSYDATTRQVRCAPTTAHTPADIITAFWGAGGGPELTIILQRVASGLPQRLISIPVAAALESGGALSQSWFDCRSDVDPSSPRFPAGFKVTTPAAFEGGGHWNCRVVRPSWTCKLRRHMEPLAEEMLLIEDALRFPRRGLAEDFCAVCQYVIMFAVDPSLLPEVDALL